MGPEPNPAQLRSSPRKFNRRPSCNITLKTVAQARLIPPGTSAGVASRANGRRALRSGAAVGGPRGGGRCWNAAGRRRCRRGCGRVQGAGAGRVQGGAAGGAGRALRREARGRPVVQAVLEVGPRSCLFMLVDLLPVGWLTNRDSNLSRVASIHGFPGVPAVICELLTLCSRTVDPISSEGSLPVRRSRPSLSGPMNAIFAALLVAMSAGRIRHCIFMS